MKNKPEDDDDEDQPRAEGRPEKTVRWTIDHAASEFGPDRRTLTKRLRELGILRGTDGKYATRDICRAIYENSSPRDRKDLQHAELLKVQTENARRERIPIGIVLALWDAALQAAAATLKAAKGRQLAPAKINEILGLLRAVKLPVKW